MIVPTATLMLIEGDPDEAAIIQQHLEQIGIRAHFQLLHNGIQTIEYLSGRGKYSDSSAFPVPAAIILDSTLPVMGAMEFLRWLRNESARPDLPVILLVPIQAGTDTELEEQWKVQCVCQKPEQPEQLEFFYRKIAECCRQILHLP